MQRLLVIYFLILLFISCNNKPDKQFYGTYENLDTNRITFSRISFYENDKYSFYSSTCFGQTRDSGNFTLTNDIISFSSFNLALPDTTLHKGRNLSKENFLYKSGKILYIQHLSPPNRPKYSDTILVGKKKL